MKPLSILDRLSKNFPDLPLVDLTGVGPLIVQWGKNVRQLRTLYLPFPKLIFGFNVLLLTRSTLSFLSPSALNSGPPLEFGFVVSRLDGTIYADPFTILEGVPGVVPIDPSIKLDYPGPLQPTRRLSDETKFREMCGDWFDLVIDSLVVLNSLRDVFLKDEAINGLSRNQRRARERTALPNSYKVLAARKV